MRGLTRSMAQDEPLTGEIMPDASGMLDKTYSGLILGRLQDIAHDLVVLSGMIPRREFDADEPITMAMKALEAAVHNVFVANIYTREEPKT